MIDLNLNPSKKDLRVFGLAAMAFLMVIAWIVFRRTGSTTAAVSLVAIGIVLAALGWTVPRALRPVFIALVVVNYPIGWVVTHVVMAVIFYLVVSPVGIIMRLTGRDAMARRFDRSATTYWLRRRQDPRSERYFRQF